MPRHPSQEASTLCRRTHAASVHAAHLRPAQTRLPVLLTCRCRPWMCVCVCARALVSVGFRTHWPHCAGVRVAHASGRHRQPPLLLASRVRYAHAAIARDNHDVTPHMVVQCVPGESARASAPPVDRVSTATAAAATVLAVIRGGAFPPASQTLTAAKHTRLTFT